MLFEPRPKDVKADLFDREEKYAQLKNLLYNETPLILIKGLRRSGKTSLLRTYLNEEEPSYIWVDLRALTSKNIIKKSEVLTRFEISISEFIEKTGGNTQKLLDRLDRINGITAFGNGISFSDKDNANLIDLMSVFETLNKWVDEKLYFKNYVVLAIDEAQKFSNTQDFDMAQLIATLYDNCKHILLILSGSEIGLLEKFINNVENSNTISGNALSGFSKEIVELPCLTSSQSKEYLKLGFAQINLQFLEQENFNEVISKVSDSFGGVIGWLNNFGVKFKTKSEISDSYIEEIYKDAIPVIRSEFESLTSIQENPEHYALFMYTLSLQSTLKWHDLTKSLRSHMSIQEIEAIRDNLLNYGFIKKIEGYDEYLVSDLLYRHVFSNKYIN